jgi:Rrf2 family protein
MTRHLFQPFFRRQIAAALSGYCLFAQNILSFLYDYSRSGGVSKGGAAMRISTKGRYSLEALLYLALLPAGATASTHEIAENTGISERYLEQLFIPLRKHRFIQGTRGVRGGYSLAGRGTTITVGDVLGAVGVTIDIVACVGEAEKSPGKANDTDANCPQKATCASRNTWSALYNEISAFVNSVTLTDVAEAYRASDAIEYSI